MYVGSINSSQTSYYRSSTLKTRTGEVNTREDSFVNEYNGNKNGVVTQSSSYVYCHSAHAEYDTSLDYDKVMFGTYHEDGSAMEIYKSKGYTDENPLMDIYIRNPDGEWSKETVNAKEIDLSHCSYAEMRVAMAYLKESGVITDNWTYMELLIANEKESPIDTFNDMFISQNWLERVQRWMKWQIEGGQYASYQRFACLYSAFTNYQAAKAS